MAKFSRTEFAKKCGITLGNLSTYVGRGKVVVDVDNTIDDTNPINKKFQFERAINAEKKQLKSPTPPDGKKLIGVSIPETEQSTVEKRTAKKISDITLQKEQADLDKKLLDIALARQKLDRETGKNIPVDIVKRIISEFSKSIITNYQTYSEQLISDICFEQKIQDQERLNYIANLTKAVNKLHDQSINSARITLKNSLGSVNLEEQSDSDDQL